MKIISLIIVFCAVDMGNWQSEPDPIKLLTNQREKYWDIKNGFSWRLNINGVLSEYCYKDKVRMEINTYDFVLSDHRWGAKKDTIYEMSGARVIGEYQILKLTTDTMILRSKFGTYGKDTLFFQSSKDQISRIKKSGKTIKMVD